jgi:hypothetical protein
MSGISPHTRQIVDGSEISLLIAQLAGYDRTSASRDATTGYLTFLKRPDLYTGTGNPTGKLLKLVGSMDVNLTLGKTNKEVSYFNDDGWVQDKITRQNFSMTLQGNFIKNTSTTAPDLDASFKAIYEGGLSKEDEVYLETQTSMGIIDAQTGIAVTVATPADTITFATAHGLFTGLKLQFTAGTLPSGLSLATNYYAVVISSTVIKVASSFASATALVPVTVAVGTAGVAVLANLPAREKALIQGGVCKIMNLGEQVAADGILAINATAKGQGKFIYGFMDVDLN